MEGVRSSMNRYRASRLDDQTGWWKSGASWHSRCSRTSWGLPATRASPREVNGHLAPEYLRAEVDHLSFGPVVARFATPVLRAVPGQKKKAGDCLEESRGSHRPVDWSGKPDSNRRPSAWEADALPTELFPHFGSQICPRLGLPSRRRSARHPHQMRQTFSFTMGCPGLHEKAFANSGTLGTSPFTRQAGGNGGRWRPGPACPRGARWRRPTGRCPRRSAAPG